VPPSFVGDYASQGPYLQAMTATSVKIMWRPKSGTPASVTVYIGIEPLLFTAAYTGVVPSGKSDVAVTVVDLEPNTRYYYAVCSSVSCQTSNATFTFQTAPTVGTSQALRMLVLGDPGQGRSGGGNAVVSAARNWMGDRKEDMWLLLGDDAYNSGTDKEYTNNLINYFRPYLRTVPVWPLTGNHDASSNPAGQTGPYFELFKPDGASSTPSGTAAYYSFNYGNVHVVCLDSYFSSRSRSGAMLRWLEDDLANIDHSETKWLIAAWHHPVYSRGTHDSDKESYSIDMRSNALPMLEEAGLDLLLTGHSHSYERSYFVKGHYGKSSTFSAASHVVQSGNGGGVLGGSAYTKPPGLTPLNGMVTITCGNSALVRSSSHSSAFDHPAMVKIQGNDRGFADYASFVVDVEDNVLKVTTIGATGKIWDSFSIVKQ
jgi:acid phosphatase type 7